MKNIIVNSNSTVDKMGAFKKLTFRQKLQFLIIVVGSTMAVMSGALLAPNLPAMSEHFYGEENVEFYVKLMLTVPGLTIALTSFFVGMVLDAFGRKRIILIFMVVYAISGAGGLYLNSITTLLISRAVLGVAISVLMSGFMTLLGDYYKGPVLEKLMGIYVGSLGLSAMVFLLLGGLLADINWRMPFLLYPLVLFLMVPFIFYIDEPLVEKNIDKEAYSFFSKQLLNAPWLLLGVVFLFSVFARISFYNTPVQLSFFFGTLGVYSGVKAGMGVGALALASALTALMYGSVRKVLSYTAIYIFSLIVLGVGYWIVGNASNFYQAIFGLIIAGIGLGFFPAITMGIVLTVTSTAIRGRVVGLLTAVTFAGQFVSPIITDPIIAVTSYAFSFKFYGIVSWVLVLPTSFIMYYRHRNKQKNL